MKPVYATIMGGITMRLIYIYHSIQKPISQIPQLKAKS
jgi:hypothetical protein